MSTNQPPLWFGEGFIGVWNQNVLARVPFPSLPHGFFDVSNTIAEESNKRA
jgi:hypothetical protein